RLVGHIRRVAGLFGMTDAIARSREAIAGYLGKDVRADLDGTLFESRAGTFVFVFKDPAALREELSEDYGDYLRKWDAAIVPVATGASAKSPGHLYAWLLLHSR